MKLNTFMPPIVFIGAFLWALGQYIEQEREPFHSLNIKYQGASMNEKCKLPPDKLPMKAVMFGDGANGAAMQMHANDEFGISCIATRKDRKSPFEEKWTALCLPDQEFKSYKALRAAMEESK